MALLLRPNREGKPMPDPIRAALERLQEYAVAHPEHDTGEQGAAARAEVERQQQGQADG